MTTGTVHDIREYLGEPELFARRFLYFWEDSPLPHYIEESSALLYILLWDITRALAAGGSIQEEERTLEKAAELEKWFTGCDEICKEVRRIMILDRGDQG